MHTLSTEIAAVMNVLCSDHCPIPTMKEALMSAGLTADMAGYATRICTKAGLDAKKNGKLFSGFTEEDADNVVLYTFNFGPSNFENNLYCIINKALTGNDVESLNMVRWLLFLVIQSIRKLPRVSGRTLYRGMRDTVGKYMHM